MVMDGGLVMYVYVQLALFSENPHRAQSKSWNLTGVSPLCPMLCNAGMI